LRRIVRSESDHTVVIVTEIDEKTELISLLCMRWKWLQGALFFRAYHKRHYTDPTVLFAMFVDNYFSLRLAVKYGNKCTVLGRHES